MIARLQRTHDAEVDRGIARVLRVLDLHENIAGMHVGMEKIIAEHLREKDLDPVRRELGDIRARGTQPLEIVDDDSVDALHHHDVHPAVVPEDFRDVQQRRSGEVALQLGRVPRLAKQIQLIQNGLAVFAHQLGGPQAARIRPIFFRQVRERGKHFEVALDDFTHAGTQDFDHHLAAGFQRRHVHLSDRRRGQRRGFETAENIRERPGKRLFDGGDRRIAAERRNAVLKLRQLIGNVDGQQVRAGSTEPGRT